MAMSRTRQPASGLFLSPSSGEFRLSREFAFPCREAGRFRRSAPARPVSREFDLPKEGRFLEFSLCDCLCKIVNRLGVTGLRNSHARDKKANRSDLGTRTGARTNMRSILNEAFEWLYRAEQAREVAGQLTDPGARKAVLELAESFDRLARAAATPAVLRRRELARKD